MRKNSSGSSWLIWLCLLGVANKYQHTVVGQSSNIVVISNDKRLSTFKGLLDQAGVSPSIGKTVFGPTTEAFERFREIDPVRYDKWMDQPEFFLHFKELMEWHLITEGTYTQDEIFDGTREGMVNPQGTIKIDQKLQTIGNVGSNEFLDPNIDSSDGIIHIIDQVIVPPFLGYDMIQQLLRSRQEFFSFSNMANLALHVGLDDRLNAAYDNGLTFLVPANRRFNRAEIYIPKMLQPDMFNYTRNFILCHMITDIYHEAQVFAMNEQSGEDQFLVKSELGTHMWITSTENVVRFQSQELLLPDQPTNNGYVTFNRDERHVQINTYIILLFKVNNQRSEEDKSNMVVFCVVHLSFFFKFLALFFYFVGSIFHGLEYPLFPPYITDFAFFTPKSTNIDTSDCFRIFSQCRLTSEDIAELFDTKLTVFCPTREAFTLFNYEDFNRLLSPDWYRHACEFLFNHITEGALTRAELASQAPRRIKMLNGAVYNLRKSGDDRPRIQNGNQEGRSNFGDLIALDGYLHTIDTPITPTAVSHSLYDKIAFDPDTSILKTNIDFIRLTDYIAMDSPLTILAPDNAAFRRVEFDTIDGGPIIKRHILVGLLFCDRLANQTEVITVDGEVLDIEVKADDSLWVGGAKVYDCDILAHNGVLHHIDRVIGLDFDSPSPTQSPAPTITGVPTKSPAPSASPAALFAENPDNGAVPIYLPPVEAPINKLQADPTRAPAPVSGSGSTATTTTITTSTLLVAVTGVMLLWSTINA